MLPVSITVVYYCIFSEIVWCQLLFFKITFKQSCQPLHLCLYIFLRELLPSTSDSSDVTWVFMFAHMSLPPGPQLIGPESRTPFIYLLDLSFLNTWTEINEWVSWCLSEINGSILEKSQSSACEIFRAGQVCHLQTWLCAVISGICLIWVSLQQIVFLSLASIE